MEESKASWKTPQSSEGLFFEPLNCFDFNHFDCEVFHPVSSIVAQRQNVLRYTRYRFRSEDQRTNGELREALSNGEDFRIEERPLYCICAAKFVFIITGVNYSSIS